MAENKVKCEQKKIKRKAEVTKEVFNNLGIKIDSIIIGKNFKVITKKVKLKYKNIIM